MEWLIALVARIALLVMWISTPLINRTFQGNWVLPLLGILFLPLTALTYILVFTIAGGVTGWNWLWVVVAFILDLAAHSYPARRGQQRRAAQRRAATPPKVE